MSQNGSGSDSSDSSDSDSGNIVLDDTKSANMILENKIYYKTINLDEIGLKDNNPKGKGSGSTSGSGTGIGLSDCFSL